MFFSILPFNSDFSFHGMPRLSGNLEDAEHLAGYLPVFRAAGVPSERTAGNRPVAPLHPGSGPAAASRGLRFHCSGADSKNPSLRRQPDSAQSDSKVAARLPGFAAAQTQHKLRLPPRRESTRETAHAAAIPHPATHCHAPYSRSRRAPEPRAGHPPNSSRYSFP